ncbi:MAG: magnesium transporter CorA family protein [Patescibacteria group bacterium]
MKNIYEFKNKNLTWINVTKPAKPQIDFLSEKYNLNQEDVLDVLPPIQRSKIIERPDYIFMILLFPVYDREDGDIYTEEVDFFITKNRLITVHSEKIPFLSDFFGSCKKNPKTSKCSGDMANLLYEIINGLLNYCFPMLRHLNLDLEDVEHKLFKEYEKKSTVDRTVRIKTNIFDFQRIMQSHEYVLGKLIEIAPRFFPAKKLENNFIHLAEYAREINLSLQTFKDTANALHDANTTLVNYRVNEIAKLLSVFAVIIFPLTLLSAMFGMNTSHTPIIGTSFDFWKITGMMVMGTAVMLAFFKWRKWI